MALQMLESGDWITPRLSPDVHHFTKPPLTYWAIAASLSVAGRTELAARLPIAFAFVATALLVAAIAANLRLRPPWVPAAIYATTLLPCVAANIVTTDTLLTLWETLAAWSYTRWRMAGGRRGRSVAAAVMWIGFGLAFLTKGPVGLLPLAVFLLHAYLEGGTRAARRLVTVTGVGLFLIIGLGWFAVVVGHHPGLLAYFIGQETVDRVASGAHGRNPEWYGALLVYLPTYLVGGLPWTALLWKNLRSAGQLFRLSSWQRWRMHDPVLLFLLLWALAPLTVFALARSRLPLYLLPLFVPLALLYGRSATPTKHCRTRSTTLLAGTAWIVVLLGLRLGAAVLATDQSVKSLAEMIQTTTPVPVIRAIFVDTRNHYGLVFYLGCNVEHVGMTKADLNPMRPERRKTLADALPSLGSRDVVLVRATEADRFAEELSHLGGSARLLGSWRQLDVYRLTEAEAAR